MNYIDVHELPNVSQNYKDTFPANSIVTIEPGIYIPNVGRSSFINFFAKKSQLITSDRPGVTKKNTWLKINDKIQMMDTPGILFKKSKDVETGFIRALIKCVKWDVRPKYEGHKFAHNFYK